MRQSAVVAIRRRAARSLSPEIPVMAKRITLIVIGIAILVLAGGGVLLANWQIPAPTKALEKVIPNDRFGR
jgi:hypothetical protein